MNPNHMVILLIILVIAVAVSIVREERSRSKPDELIGRKVEYYKKVKDTEYGTIKYIDELVGVATFEGFGVDEGDEGGTYSTAIIRLPDGKIKNIWVEMIRFID